jgi:integrase/recombinase XerD
MKTKLKLPALDAKAEEWLHSLAESERTRATYASALRVFQLFRGEQLRLKRAGHSPTLLQLRSLEVDVLAQFQSWMVECGYSLFSRRTYVAAVVAFLGYAYDKDWLPPRFSIDRAHDRVKKNSRRSDYPTPDENQLRAVLRVVEYWDAQAPPDGDTRQAHLRRLDILRARAFVHLIYGTAGRIGEVCQLKRKDIQDGRRKEVQVIGKGDKRRNLFITPEARAAIAAYVATREDEYEPLFIHHHREYGKAATRQSLWNIVKVAVSELELDDISPHDFRHYRASQMLEQGAPLEAIQEILGHSDISTTRKVYAHFSKPKIREIFDRTTLSAKDALKDG